MALHALFIAVPEYQHALISRLPGTRNDAEALHKQFHYGLKCGDKARLLVAPTVAEVRKAFAAVGEALRQGDTFVLYFSGHGVERPGTDEQYLLLHGAEMDAIHDGEWENLKDALSDSYLRNSLMRRWPPVHRVFVYDACRTHLEHHMGVGQMLPFASEAALDRLAGKAAQYGRKPRPQADGITAPSREQDGTALSTVYLKSCRSGQKAYEIQGAERGVFGLSLHAELEDSVLNQRDVVLAREFVQRLQQRMDGLLREHGLGDTQQVWMSECPAPVPLWLPPTLRMAPRPPAAPAVPTGVDPTALSSLLVNWATQLQAGRYTEPPWDSCAGSLGGLRHVGVPHEALQALQAVAQSQQQAAEVKSAQVAEQLKEQADVSATARKRLLTVQEELASARSALAEAEERIASHAKDRRQMLALQRELTASKAANDESEARISRLQKRVTKLAEELKQRPEEDTTEAIAKLSAQLSTLAHEKQHAEQALAMLQQRAGEWQRELFEQRAELKRTQAQLAKVQTEAQANASREPARPSHASTSRHPGQRWREADWSPELVWCPAGSFLMGSPEGEPERQFKEGPQCQVKFNEGFWIGRCAISFAEFDRFVGATSRPLAKDQGWGRGKQPAINISWHDAQEYLVWLNDALGEHEHQSRCPACHL